MLPAHESLQEREPLLSRDHSLFKFKPEELAGLIDSRDPELLMKYGGTKKILEGLRVDPAVGLSSDEGLENNGPKNKPFQERQKFFGKNVSLLSYIENYVHLKYALKSNNDFLHHR